MLRTQKTDRCNAASNRARRSTADSALIAATLLSPLLCRPWNWRHSQPPHSKPFTTTVAKNALGDTRLSATECPTYYRGSPGCRPQRLPGRRSRKKLPEIGPPSRHASPGDAAQVGDYANLGHPYSPSWRQLQPLHTQRLTLCVAKNAVRDRSPQATEFASPLTPPPRAPLPQYQPSAEFPAAPENAR
jgi:hypothetical protein